MTSEALLANECFICGLEKNEFEKREKSFLHHIQHEHKILSYVHFMVYLKSKRSDQISGVELYVRELFVKQKSTEWYPIQNTVYLEGTEESAEDRVGKNLDDLKNNLEAVERILKDKWRILASQFGFKMKMPGADDLEALENGELGQDLDDSHMINDPEIESDREAFNEFYRTVKQQELINMKQVAPDDPVAPGQAANDGNEDESTYEPLYKKQIREKAVSAWKENRANLHRDLQELERWKERFCERIKEEFKSIKTESAVKPVNPNPDSAKHDLTTAELQAQILDKIEKFKIRLTT